MATAEANDPIYDRIVGNLLKERQELEVDKIFRAWSSCRAATCI